MEHLHELVEFTAQCVRESGADAEALHDIRLAVSEVCTNVVFDPSILSPPDTESDWERREPGNLGWHLVHSVMDEVRHEPRGDRGNIVILAKRIGPTSASAPESG
jgi:anti-sigma regulatory factor (Ser/Thr protein kinase)